MVTATLNGVTDSPFRSNDEPLSPDQAAMLADSLDLATRDLVHVTNGWSERRRMEYRLCEHDVAHPDVDAVAFATRYRTNYAGRETRESDPEWHECDGCCRRESD